MPLIYIHEGVGAGQTSTSFEDVEGKTFRYVVMPGAGYGFEYLEMDGVRHTALTYTFVVRKHDYTVYVHYSLLPLPPPPAPPPVWDSAEQAIETIGASCELVRKGIFGRTWFSYRNTVTGKHGNWRQYADEIRYEAERFGDCNIPKPPTLPEWQNNINTMLQNITKSIGDAVSGFSQRITTIEKHVNDVFAGLESWLEERIVAILLRALDREAEKEGK